MVDRNQVLLQQKHVAAGDLPDSNSVMYGADDIGTTTSQWRGASDEISSWQHREQEQRGTWHTTSQQRRTTHRHPPQLHVSVGKQWTRKPSFSRHPQKVNYHNPYHHDRIKQEVVSENYNGTNAAAALLAGGGGQGHRVTTSTGRRQKAPRPHHTRRTSSPPSRSPRTTKKERTTKTTDDGITCMKNNNSMCWMKEDRNSSGGGAHFQLNRKNKDNTSATSCRSKTTKQEELRISENPAHQEQVPGPGTRRTLSGSSKNATSSKDRRVVRNSRPRPSGDLLVNDEDDYKLLPRRRMPIGVVRRASPMLEYAHFRPECGLFRSPKRFPQDWLTIKKLANANYGRVFLCYHYPSQKTVVVKRLCNSVSVADGICRHQGLVERHTGGTDAHGENPVIEVAASAFLSQNCPRIDHAVYNNLQHRDTSTSSSPAPSSSSSTTTTTTTTSADFHCANLLESYGSWMDTDYTYLASEYCARGELFTYLQQHGTLSAAHIRIILRQMLDAVSYMHDRGIAHRDISLENVLLTEEPLDRFVRVMDLGVACKMYDFDEHKGISEEIERDMDNRSNMEAKTSKKTSSSAHLAPVVEQEASDENEDDFSEVDVGWSTDEGEEKHDHYYYVSDTDSDEDEMKQVDVVEGSSGNRSRDKNTCSKNYYSSCYLPYDCLGGTRLSRTLAEEAEKRKAEDAAAALRLYAAASRSRGRGSTTEPASPLASCHAVPVPRRTRRQHQHHVVPLPASPGLPCPQLPCSSSSGLLPSSYNGCGGAYPRKSHQELQWQRTESTRAGSVLATTPYNHCPSKRSSRGRTCDSLLTWPEEKTQLLSGGSGMLTKTSWEMSTTSMCIKHQHRSPPSGPLSVSPPPTARQVVRDPTPDVVDQHDIVDVEGDQEVEDETQQATSISTSGAPGVVLPECCLVPSNALYNYSPASCLSGGPKTGPHHDRTRTGRRPASMDVDPHQTRTPSGPARNRRSTIDDDYYHFPLKFLVEEGHRQQQHRGKFADVEDICSSTFSTSKISPSARVSFGEEPGSLPKIPLLLHQLPEEDEDLNDHDLEKQKFVEEDAHALLIQVQREEEQELLQLQLEQAKEGLAAVRRLRQKKLVYVSGFVGKHYYRAPEMYGHGSWYLPGPGDMFAVAVCAFIMLTGRPLFRKAVADESGFRFFKAKGVRALLKKWNFFEKISTGALQQDQLHHKKNLDDQEHAQEESLNNQQQVEVGGAPAEELLDELIDLIEKMMHLVPEKRLSAREALEHPFFRRTQSRDMEEEKLMERHLRTVASPSTSLFGAASGKNTNSCQGETRSNGKEARLQEDKAVALVKNREHSRCGSACSGATTAKSRTKTRTTSRATRRGTTTSSKKRHQRRYRVDENTSAAPINWMRKKEETHAPRHPRLEDVVPARGAPQRPLLVEVPRQAALPLQEEPHKRTSTTNYSLFSAKSGRSGTHGHLVLGQHGDGRVSHGRYEASPPRNSSTSGHRDVQEHQQHLYKNYPPSSSRRSSRGTPYCAQQYNNYNCRDPRASPRNSRTSTTAPHVHLHRSLLQQTARVDSHTTPEVQWAHSSDPDSLSHDQGELPPVELVEFSSEDGGREEIPQLRRSGGRRTTVLRFSQTRLLDLPLVLPEPEWKNESPNPSSSVTLLEEIETDASTNEG
ncbi:unnamed protein product [Amoebophrya sp. A25]|nr:unnamed protein product [Amoebophrya sp. A25]|eukprot:GSA25T00024292001.1